MTNAIEYVKGLNYDKLAAELIKRGVTFSEASKALGHTTSYITGNKNRKTPFKKAYLDILEALYGINEEDVVDKTEVVTVVPTSSAIVAKVVEADVNVVSTSVEVEDTLYKIIYSAVYEAVKKAWSE